MPLGFLAFCLNVFSVSEEEPEAAQASNKHRIIRAEKEREKERKRIVFVCVCECERERKT